MALTQTQADFLLQHGVPLSRVIDAEGKQGKRLVEAMREADALVAINANSCSRSYAHRMKLRSGHCFQCKPESLGFILRHENAGFLYVAYSERECLVKIGTCSALSERMYELNRKGYGGAYDWDVVFSERVLHAGRVEAAVHSALRRWRVDRTYHWAGVRRGCYEIYGCGISHAIQTVETEIALS